MSDERHEWTNEAGVPMATGFKSHNGSVYMEIGGYSFPPRDYPAALVSEILSLTAQLAERDERVKELEKSNARLAEWGRAYEYVAGIIPLDPDDYRARGDAMRCAEMDRDKIDRLISRAEAAERERDELKRELAEADEAIQRLAWNRCSDCDGDGYRGFALGTRQVKVSCESCGGHEDSLGDGYIPNHDNIAETMALPAVRRALALEER